MCPWPWTPCGKPLTFEKLLQGLALALHLHGAAGCFPVQRGSPAVPTSPWLGVLSESLHFLFVGVKCVFSISCARDPGKWLSHQNDYKTRRTFNHAGKAMSKTGRGSQSMDLPAGRCFSSASRLCFKDLCPQWHTSLHKWAIKAALSPAHPVAPMCLYHPLYLPDRFRQGQAKRQGRFFRLEKGAK